MHTRRASALEYMNVDVDVYDKDRFLARLSPRPVRLMPGGNAGVVYDGVVYPLREGNIIEVNDETVGRDDCSGFARPGDKIRYLVDIDADEVVDHLGIGDWYVESARYGHYLAFDGSREAAERLVDAVDATGLGVRGWGESRRPADNGKRYDWYLRLEFRGSRDDCLEVLEQLLASEAVEEDQGPSTVSATWAPHLTILVMNLSDEPMDTETVAGRLASFCSNDSVGGYLAWRYHELRTRPGNTADDSSMNELLAMAAVVRDDKALVSRLSMQHGPFLDNRPHIAERALRAELDKVDSEAEWRSPDDALRRSRSSLSFLRSAIILSFAADDGFAWLNTVLPQLMPPREVSAGNGVARNVAAAASNLARMITLVEQMTTRPEPSAVLAKGRQELLDLQDGEFDFLSRLTLQTQSMPDRRLSDLSFEVLPPGELVGSFVDELRKSGTFEGREVDRRRLDVLEEVAKRFPSRPATMHRGAFGAGDRDNGYVVLRLPLSDGRGEDAVAISPLKGEHATFVVRHGCGKRRPWTEVLSRTKTEAKDLGAKRLVFRVNVDYPISVYEAMASRIVAWLRCSPDEYDHGELYFDYRRGRYAVWIPDDIPDDYEEPTAERAGARSHQSSQRRTSSPNLIQRVLRWF